MGNLYTIKKAQEKQRPQTQRRQRLSRFGLYIVIGAETPRRMIGLCERGGQRV